MELALAGLNHRTAPLELRERLAFEDLPRGLGQLLSLGGVREGLILSTCNRVEVVGLCERPEVLAEFLCRGERLEPSRIYLLRGEEVIRHLVEVASGLDSMVVGEPQILGQLREAHRVARACGATGSVLNRLLPRVLKLAARVRQDTELGRRPVSVASVGVELAGKVVGDLRGRVGLIVGAGEMGRLVAQHLRGRGVRELVLVTRTPREELAQALGARWSPPERLVEEMQRSDVVIASAAASRLITVQHVASAMRRRGRPLFVLDLGVPRNVSPEVGRLQNVYLFDLDDLEAMAEENRARRLQEVARARALVDRLVEDFRRWSRRLEASSVVDELMREVERLRRREVDRTVRSWRAEGQREMLEVMTQSLVRKVFHPLLRRVRQAGGTPRGRVYVEVIRELFALESPNGLPQDRDEG